MQIIYFSMKKYCLVLIMLCTLQAVAQFNQGELITRNNYFEIPFTQTHTEIHAKAGLRGDEYDFMLDTGAPTFISSDLQKKYKFPVLIRSKTQDGSGNVVKTEIVLIDTIRFGPFVFTGIPAVVIDMDNSPIGCLHLPGNLGSNMLRHLYVQFDIKEHRVGLTDKKAMLKKQIPAQPMHISAQADVYFPVKLNDSFTDTIHYDSGDGQYYSMSKRKMDNFVALFPGQVIRNGFGTLFMGIGGAGDPFTQYVAKPQSVQVGAGAMAGAAVTIAGNDRSRMGRDMLNYGVLDLNYPDSSYAFETYGHPDVQPHFDFGFHPVMDGDEIVVGCVWKNSGAETQGLQIGDHILSIDDLDFTKLSKCDRVNFARELARTGKNTITLTYRHKKQKPQTITLEKKNL